MRTRLFSLLFAQLILSGCAAIITKGDLPSKDVQPAVTWSEALEAPSYAHKAWLQDDGKVDLQKASEVRSEARPRGYDRHSMFDPDSVVETNIALTEYYRKTESRYYLSHDERPRVCLALSGGGIRAAAFSIGALQGLSERGQLAKVDVVSAVSGGSYALAWYLTHRLNDVSEIEILNDRYITKTTRPSLDMFVGLLGYISRRLDFLTDFSDFANGLASSGLATSYELILESTFPAPDGTDAATMKDVADAVREAKVPLPIFGVSAFALRPPEGAEDQEEAITNRARSVALYDSYYEVTPYRKGIAGFGFQEKDLDPLKKIWEYVALSGAAIDQPFKDRESVGFDRSVRLGGRLSMVVPTKYPQPGLGQDVSDYSRIQFYASDGGFADNLGVFPLVMRECERVIVVDSEYDPEWQFEGYTSLKDHLATEHNLDFSVPSIDERILKNRERIPSSRTYRRAGFDLPDTEKARSCARSSDETPCGARLGELKPLIGTVTLPPHSKIELAQPRHAEVIYVKLGISSNDKELLPTEVQQLLSACFGAIRCNFPQDPTYDQEHPSQSQQYSIDQFRGYISLGRAIVREVENERPSD